MRMLGKERTPETELQVAQAYCEAYPFGVPLKVVNFGKGNTTPDGRTFFYFDIPKTRKTKVFVLNKSQNYVQHPTNKHFWLCLTAQDTYRKHKIFGVPALAAACLFFQNGTNRVCPIHGVVHRNDAIISGKTIDNIWNLPEGFISEWDAEDYEREKIS